MQKHALDRALTARARACRQTGGGPLLTAVVWLLAALSVPAQEALRYSLASEEAARARRASADVPYNIKLGEAKLRFSTMLGLEYNDNINVAEVGAQDDLIIRPEVNMDLYWPITERNALQLNVGVGYSKFLEFDQNDSMIIRPGSLLSFDFYVDNFRINLRNRFSFFQDPTQQGAVSGTNVFNARYGLGENVIGIGVDWDLNKIILSAGYDHLMSFATTDDFSFLDRTSDFFYLRGAVLAAPELTLGIEGTTGFTRYDENRISDSDQYSIGPFADWQLSQFMRLGVRAGYQSYSFSATRTATAPADTSTFYASLMLDHAINRYVTYNLGIGHQVSPGVNSDAINLTFVRLAARWRVLRQLDVHTDLYYEHGEETGAATTTLAPETFDRYGFTIRSGYLLTQKLTAGLRYTIIYKDSDQPLRGYTQNVVALDLNYRF